jgi:hypothetical protein
MDSKRFTLNGADVKSCLTTAALFLAPMTLIYFTFVEQQVDTNGFQWSDFVPNLFVQGAMVSYGLAEVTALIKKFVQGKPQ